jgi:hypothetical protein
MRMAQDSLDINAIAGNSSDSAKPVFSLFHGIVLLIFWLNHCSKNHTAEQD